MTGHDVLWNDISLFSMKFEPQFHRVILPGEMVIRPEIAVRGLCTRFVIGTFYGIGTFAAITGGIIVVPAVVAQELGGTLLAQPPLLQSYLPVSPEWGGGVVAHRVAFMSY